MGTAFKNITQSSKIFLTGSFEKNCDLPGGDQAFRGGCSRMVRGMVGIGPEK